MRYGACGFAARYCAMVARQRTQPRHLHVSCWQQPCCSDVGRVQAMRIRITRPPPAPLMDGFDVSRFQFNHIYNVSPPLGRYLVLAGYGEPAARSTERSHDRSRRRQRRTRR